MQMCVVMRFVCEYECRCANVHMHIISTQYVPLAAFLGTSLIVKDNGASIGP